jgi:shikimate kinase
MRGKAYAPGSGTLVNAIATGKGAAYAIDLKVWADVHLNHSGTVEGRIRGGEGGDPSLIERCVQRVLERFGGEYGATVETRSEVPISRGLSSSSAASNAAVLATLEALGEEMEDLDIVRLAIDCSREVGVTITGALDDASASYFGGVTVTDNREGVVLSRSRLPDGLEVLIYVPQESSPTAAAPVERMRLFREEVALAHGRAMEGNFTGAMILNGLIYCAALGYSPLPAVLALEGGALGAGLSGTGTAFTALCSTEAVDEVREAWETLDGDLIRTRPNHEGARRMR